MVALQETVAVPDPMMLAPMMLPQFRPLDAMSVRLTVPVNPFTAVVDIVVMLGWPTFEVEGEVADTPKSGPEVASCTVYQFVARVWNW